MITQSKKNVETHPLEQIRYINRVEASVSFSWINAEDTIFHRLDLAVTDSKFSWEICVFMWIHPVNLTGQPVPIAHTRP